MKTREQDLGARQRHRYYFRNGTMDFYVGWLLGYAQLGGLSPGALYHCLNSIQDGAPASWVSAFARAAQFQRDEAERAEQEGAALRASHAWFAPATAARAAVNFCPPGAAETSATLAGMEDAFQRGLRAGGVALEPWSVPFGDASLPAYVSRDLQRAPALVVIVGGGDTYREDLWFFGGREALARGYGVLLCDYPGQGRTPEAGLHFGEATVQGLHAAIEACRARGFKGPVALVGWSGGGLFTAKYVEAHGRDVFAWVASTPIEDMALLFERAMPQLLRGRLGSGWARWLMSLAGRFSPVLDASLKKYDAQFGPGGIASAVERFRALGKVDLERLDVPLLALVGTSEAAEGRAQARRVFDAVSARQPASRWVEFPADSGADAHCQVSNLPLAFDYIFDWFDAVGLARASA